MAAVAWTMRNTRRWTGALRMVRPGTRAARGSRLLRRIGPLRAWSRSRDLPPPPQQSFRDWWKEVGR
jgi:L-lactate dehydrogenase complex protein LldF